MTRTELERECMAMAEVVDTELVERDPLKLPSFDFGTLYVWLHHPKRRADGGEFVDAGASPRLFGRFGPHDASGDSVAEIARKLGVPGSAR